MRLHLLRIRDDHRTRDVVGNGGQVDVGLRPGCRPAAKGLLEDRFGVIGLDVPDHDDRREIGAICRSIVRFNVGQGDFPGSLGRCEALRGIGCGIQRCVARHVGRVIRRRDDALHRTDFLRLDGGKGRLGEGGMQFFVGEQLDAAIEILRARGKREGSPGLDFGRNLVEFRPQTESIVGSGAER